jgi:hypothetical protein
MDKTYLPTKLHSHTIGLCIPLDGETHTCPHLQLPLQRGGFLAARSLSDSQAQWLTWFSSVGL